ncbi:MAG: hypothetical protein EA396_12455 [Anaerolineaceae bacterium]|nr:MAG: hypothetical protein EA396_12455 [Anaerolineaceae bacterium]
MTAPPQKPDSGGGISADLRTRAITALIALPVAVVGLYIGGVLWLALMAALGAVGLLEFYAITRGDTPDNQKHAGVPPVGIAVFVALLGSAFGVLQTPALLIILMIGVGGAWVAAHQRGRARMPSTLMTIAGVAYVAVPVAFLVALRGSADGIAWVMVIFAATWGTDTAAYFGGRKWGKRQLAPRLSPKKTVEGAIFGVVGGAGAALAVLAVAGLVSVTAVIMVAVAPLVAIAGDLLESAIKRAYGVKDSHIVGLNIFPGHGGVLDRIDALIMVTLFCYPILLLGGLLS